MIGTLGIGGRGVAAHPYGGKLPVIAHSAVSVKKQQMSWLAVFLAFVNLGNGAGLRCNEQAGNLAALHHLKAAPASEGLVQREPAPLQKRR